MKMNAKKSLLFKEWKAPQNLNRGGVDIILQNSTYYDSSIMLRNFLIDREKPVDNGPDNPQRLVSKVRQTK